MATYDRMVDINHTYLQSTRKNLDPLFPDQWRADPLSSDSLIDPRRAGFRPYPMYRVVTRIEPFAPSGEVYQGACDCILPVNKYYLRNHQIVPQP